MSIDQNMPQVSGPLVDGRGIVTQAWWAFFRTMWERTGGAGGVSSADLELLAALAKQPRPADPEVRATAEGALLAALAAGTGNDTQASAEGAALLALRPVAHPVDLGEALLLALSLFRGPAETIKVVNGVPIPPVYTVANLPPAATGVGARAFVTDATATTFMSVVAGGGANAVPVVSDGANWLIG